MAVTKSLSEETRIKNPLSETSRGYSFEVAATASARATERYGKWSNEEECRELKETLVEPDREGSGRVRLTDFYWKVPVGNNWFFEETPEYLRELGVLDESSSSRGMQLVIPNYVQSASNCIEVSAFYSICCLKECEGLLGRIEKEIRSPFATPGVLLEVAQRAINAREDEPRNQTTQLAVQSVMEAAWDTVQLSPLPAISVGRPSAWPSALPKSTSQRTTRPPIPAEKSEAWPRPSRSPAPTRAPATSGRPPRSSPS